MAPYRPDLFNALHDLLPLRVLFEQPLPSYDTNRERRALENEFRCDHALVAERKAPSVISLWRRVLAEVSFFRPDVLVTHEFSQSSAGAAVIARLRGHRLRHVVWTTKSPIEIDTARGMRLLAMRWLAGTAAAVMTYSAESADQLAMLAATQRNRFFVCANHQDPVRLRRLACESLPDVLLDCQRLGVLHRRIVVVVSRLAQEKNIAATIAAFQEAFANDSEVVLVIIGEGPLRVSLKDAAAAGSCRKRIHFLGQRSSAAVQAWLSVASLSVLASSHEPYGAVVGESLIQGTPVLCSEAAGAAALIDSPTKGAVFPPGRVDLLSALLQNHRPSFASVEELAAKVRASIPAPTVADDVAGFVAAVSYAAGSRHG